MIPSIPDPAYTGVGIVHRPDLSSPSLQLYNYYIHSKYCMMKRKTILSSVVLSATATLLPSTAIAATPHTDSLATHRLEEVQVTATRASAKTPMSYTNITKGKLLKSNLGLDVPYLLLQTPSVVATSDPGIGIGYTALRVRGVDAAGINIMTNGVPLNDSESQSVFWANMPNFSSSIQDAQLQRGVGTSSNGSAAFGASLNLRTDHFSMTPTASVSLLGGAYNTFRRDVHASTGRIARHWALEARLGKTTTDGYIDRSGTVGTSYFVQGGYFGENTILKLLAFGGKQRTGIAWNGLSPEDEAKYGRRYNSAGHINPGSSPQDARYRYNTDNYEQSHYQAQLTQRLSEGLILNLTAHYTKGYGFTDEYRTGRKLEEYGLKEFILRDTNGVAIEKDGKPQKVKKISLLRTKYLDNDFAGGIATLDYKSDKLELTAGLSGNHYVGLHYGERIPVTPYPYLVQPNDRYYEDKAHKTDLSSFVKANYEVARGLNIFADLQYRFIDYRIAGTIDHFIKDSQGAMVAQTIDLKKTFNFLNPKAGIFYQFAPQHHVYGSIAVAHREPNRKNYTDVTPKDYPRAERLTDYELGYGFRSHTFTAGINFYYMNYHDQLVLNGKKSDVGGDLSENVAKSHRVGLELNASWQLSSALRWDIAGAVSKNQIKQYNLYAWSYKANNYVLTSYHDTPIAYSPQAVLSNTLTFTHRAFEAALTSQYVGMQYLDNTGSRERSLPAYHVANLRLGYELPVHFVRSWSINLQINNLLNARYASNGGAGYTFDKQGAISSYTWSYPQAGIHAFLGTTITL